LPACGGGQDVVLAIDHLYLGDTNFDGTPNWSQGWKQFGMNIDGLVSDKNSVGLCKLAAGASPAAAYPDGNNGIDNGFGKNILPILLGLSSDLSVQTNEAIAMGDYTFLLSIEGLGQETTCATTSALFRGDSLGNPPLWNGADAWPIDPTSLANPLDPTSSLCKLAQTNVVQDQFFAKLGGKVELTLGGALGFVIPIRRVQLSMQLDGNHQGATIGQLAGVIDTEELVTEMAKTAAEFDVSFCDPNSPTLMSILNQLRQASDIMKDGTQDPTKTCDGISIGIGFTMKSVKLGGVATPKPPQPDPCMP